LRISTFTIRFSHLRPNTVNTPLEASHGKGYSGQGRGTVEQALV